MECKNSLNLYKLKLLGKKCLNAELVSVKVNLKVLGLQLSLVTNMEKKYFINAPNAT